MTLAILRKQFLVSSDSLHLVKEPIRSRPAHRQVNRPEPNRLPGVLLLSCLFHPTRSRTGGAKEDRTPDLLRAKQALSQLSYGPGPRKLVGLGGLEPPTSPLSGVRSNHLSYRPKHTTQNAPLKNRPDRQYV